MLMIGFVVHIIDSRFFFYVEPILHLWFSCSDMSGPFGRPDLFVRPCDPAQKSKQDMFERPLKIRVCKYINDHVMDMIMYYS